MPSFARPTADVARGSWTRNDGATADLWAAIDDETADDTDYVISALNANSTYEVRLSSVAPAVIPRDHTLYLRGAKHAAGGNEKGVTVALVQGTTVLGSLDFPSLPATVNQQNVAIPRAMAAQITDYADLRIRLTSTGITTGGSARRRAVVTGVALRVPSAVDLVDDLLLRWGVAEATSTPGVVRLSHSGFTGEGPNRARALWELFQVMRAADFGGDERERRFTIAFYLWKHIEYERIRAEIVTGTYSLPAHQTQQTALAKVDMKLSNFIGLVRSADAEETV